VTNNFAFYRILYWADTPSTVVLVNSFEMAILDISNMFHFLLFECVYDWQCSTHSKVVSRVRLAMHQLGLFHSVKPYILYDSGSSM